MTKTMTAAEYNTKRPHGNAGLTSERLSGNVQFWTETYADWDGLHWACWYDATTGDVQMGPVNIR